MSKVAKDLGAAARFLVEFVLEQISGSMYNEKIIGIDFGISYFGVAVSESGDPVMTPFVRFVMAVNYKTCRIAISGRWQKCPTVQSVGKG